jgi:hypothetical protein
MKVSQILGKHVIYSPYLRKYITPNWKPIFPNNDHAYYLPLKETIHYHSLLLQDWDLYVHYITSSQQISETMQEQRCREFQQLLKNFSPMLLEKEENKITIKDNIVEDGLHRLSILLYKNIITDELPDQWIK